MRPRARRLELRMGILDAAELPSLRALYLQTRPPRERPLPECYQSVGCFMATPTRDTICLWSLGPLLCTSLTVAVTCASLVTNVVGNLFICGFAIGNHLSSNACKTPWPSLLPEACSGPMGLQYRRLDAAVPELPGIPVGDLCLDGQCSVSGAESLSPASMELGL